MTERTVMAQPVVHFEITGKDPDALRTYYAGLFDWSFDVGGSVAEEVSEPGRYGFTQPGSGIPGGVGGGSSHQPRVLFYIGVPDVEAALARAEALGGTRLLGPIQAPGRPLVIGHFEDPEGNILGVAATA
jgi:predicted enzyme related to lactoylglutathione lyase